MVVDVLVTLTAVGGPEGAAGNKLLIRVVEKMYNYTCFQRHYSNNVTESTTGFI